jgi:gliding motility-associated-like protein
MMKRIFIALLALYGFIIHGQCAPDAIVNNIEIQTGCVGDIPVYNVEYTVLNIGDEPITEYCIEIWNEDYYQCFDSDLFGSYEIPPGEGQLFATQFFEFTGNLGGFFVVSVDSVNDEIITGNNNTTVYYPVEWEECPIECTPDTVEVLTYIYQIDSIFTTIYETDTLFVELPNDTVIEYVDNFITDTLYIETIDTVYVDVEVFVTDTITEIEYITEYVTDTLFITTVDTIEVIVYEFLTDTVYEYISIDCETGLECIEDPGLTCPDWTSVYIPNTFSPNGDGYNDTWEMIYDLECWVDVEFKVFNRWGGLVYEGRGDSFDSYPFWNGSVNGGSYYVADGIYIYTFYARKINSVEIFRRNGHISIFR